MLIDFTVQNFRSIGEEVTFSMIASSDDLLRPNIIDETITKRRGLALLRSALLYGGNASGKTSFCRALDCMRDVVRKSATRLNEGDELPGITPFLLRRDLAEGPTLFEVRVLIEGHVFRYGFEATKDRIEREWLYVTRAEAKSREIPLFTREGQDSSKWEFGASFRGNKAFLRSQTRPENGLILSKAAQENFTQLTPLYEWFARRLKVYNMASFPSSLMARITSSCESNQESAERLASIARIVDARVTGVETDKSALVFPEEIRKAFNATIKDETHHMPAEVEQIELYLLRNRKDTGESIRMEMGEESHGTNRFLAISQLIVDAYVNGDTVILDEFEASLHVLLTKELLAAINDVDVPGKAAQFILTTHDTNLLDLARLRRDQVFMVEKNDDETEIYSLYDLNPLPKTDASLERQYLADRFGGTPKLGNLRLAIADAILRLSDGKGSSRQEEQAKENHDHVLHRG